VLIKLDKQASKEHALNHSRGWLKMDIL